MTPRCTYLDSSHGQVHARVWGEGEPLVLLHWTPGSGAMFNAAAPALAARGREVWALDMLGFGRSARATLPWTHNQHGQAMLSALDAGRFDRFDLLGGHMGGEVALEMTRLAPDRVRALVVDGAAIHWDRETRARMIAGGSYFAPAPSADGAHMLWAWGRVQWLWNAWTPGYDPAVYGPMLHQGMIDLLETRFDIRPMGEAFTNYDLRAALETLTTPTLLLTADSDTLRPGYEPALAMLRQGRGHVFSGLHPIHRPDGGEEYAAVVDAFLRDPQGAPELAGRLPQTNPQAGQDRPYGL